MAALADVVLTKAGRVQEQVELSHDTLEAAQAPTEISTQNILHWALSRARKIIEDLKQLITVNLIRHVDGSEWARRRAWVKNKHRIVKLRDNLEDARKFLFEAVNVNIL